MGKDNRIKTFATY